MAQALFHDFSHNITKQLQDLYEPADTPSHLHTHPHTHANKQSNADGFYMALILEACMQDFTHTSSLAPWNGAE